MCQFCSKKIPKEGVFGHNGHNQSCPGNDKTNFYPPFTFTLEKSNEQISECFFAFLGQKNSLNPNSLFHPFFNA